MSEKKPFLVIFVNQPFNLLYWPHAALTSQSATQTEVSQVTTGNKKYLDKDFNSCCDSSDNMSMGGVCLPQSPLLYKSVNIV